MTNPARLTSLSDLAETASDLHASTGHTLMLLIAGDLCSHCPQIVADLQARGLPFFGGVFPEIFYGGTICSDRCLIVPVPTIGPAHVLQAPFSTEKVMALPDHTTLTEARSDDDLTALVFVSGLTLDIGEFTRNLYRKYGVRVRYAGSGTGTFALDPDVPSVFSSEGLFSNAAMTVFLDTRVGLAARHGWSRCLGPFVATATKNRTIQEINWRPAFEVYAEAIKKLTGETLTVDNFRTFAAKYPIGLTKDGNEDLVREAFIVEGQAVAFSAEVLSQSPFYILEAKLDALHQAATDAAERATIESVGITLVFECLSRASYLGKEEVLADLQRIEAVSATDGGDPVPTVGLISLGEIASNKQGLLEFMNQTVVVVNVG